MLVRPVCRDPLRTLYLTRGSIAQNRTSPGYFYAQHDYPRGSLHPTVIVDIEHTLETASTSDLQPGKWVNIIGYITKLRSDRSQGEVAQGSEAGVRVHVQALMIWSAGSPKLNYYEEALQLRKDTDNL